MKKSIEGAAPALATPTTKQVTLTCYIKISSYVTQRLIIHWNKVHYLLM